MTRRPTLLRHLLTTALPASIVLCAGSGLAVAEPMIGRSFNNYGLPGAVDTPSAEMLPDAELTATAAKSELTERVGLVFQLAPRVTTALRYGKFDSTEERRGYVRDRSFDLRFQILDEAAHLLEADPGDLSLDGGVVTVRGVPSVSVTLREVAGSATNSHGLVRGTSNVHVNDASLLPDAPGVNPQASVMAVAIRNARHFLDGTRRAS